VYGKEHLILSQVIKFSVVQHSPRLQSTKSFPFQCHLRIMSHENSWFANNPYDKGFVSIHELMSQYSLSTKPTFDWDKYLRNKTLLKKLVAFVTPDPFQQQVKVVLEILDKVLCFEDLLNCVESLSPKDFVDLFPSQEDFDANIGGVLAVMMLPDVIQDTRANKDIAMTRCQQLNHARSLMDQCLTSDMFNEVVDMYRSAMSQTLIMDNNIIHQADTAGQVKGDLCPGNQYTVNMEEDKDNTDSYMLLSFGQGSGETQGSGENKESDSDLPDFDDHKVSRHSGIKSHMGGMYKPTGEYIKIATKRPKIQSHIGKGLFRRYKEFYPWYDE